MKSKIFPFIVLLFALSACSDMRKASSLGSMLDAMSKADLLITPEALDENTIWSYFTGASFQDPTYSGYIKFSLEWDDAGAIKTLIWHPNSYVYHAEYLTTLPQFNGMTPAQIDAIALHSNGRRLLLGTALEVKDEDFTQSEWDFQFVSEDSLSPQLIALAMKTVQAHLPTSSAAKSFYLPAPQQLAYTVRESAAFESAGVKLASRQITSDRVCYANGWGAGFVKILNAAELEEALSAGTIQSDEILVLESIPRELPAVAGIIIGTPSSPSSHPALLAQMLGIPYFYEKNAMTSETWKRLAASHEPVYLKALGDAYQGCEILIRDAQSLATEDLVRLTALKKPQPLALAPYDITSPTKPLALDMIGMNDGSRVGAKAANVAELKRLIPNNTVTEGLALPLSAYYSFLQTAKSADGQALRPQYDALLQRLLSPGLSLSETLPLLTQLRTLIDKAKVPSALSTEMLTAIEGTFPRATRIKLRSSSNMEDLPEFNGAGLYDSKGACVGDDSLASGAAGLCEVERDEVIKSVKKVWSSLYSMKAWVARRTFAIEESNVGMGVLIQKSYQGELANGVALGQYPENSYFGEDGLPDIEVLSTGFPGEEDSVTNPPVGKIPETIRIQKTSNEVTVASSEVPRGQKLLSEADYQSLYSLIETIYRHYEQAKKPSDPRSFILDLEWKLISVDDGHKIIIKQVRPVPNPSASTQGLGSGTIVIGEKKALLCPNVQEDSDALSKLKLSFPIDIGIALHEVPYNDELAMTSPITSLSSSGHSLTLPAKAELSHDAWNPIWGSANEGRLVTLSNVIHKDGEAYTLSWSMKQTRAVSQKNRLLDGVQSLWTLDFALSQGDKKQAYVLTVGADHCDSDKFQGITPGAYNASLSYSQGRKPPRTFVETFDSINQDGLGIVVQSQTSFQGFDKTRFLSIEKIQIKGLIGRDLELDARNKGVYAPAHHNFQWSYAFDMSVMNGLTKFERDQLAARGIHYLVIENPGEQYNIEIVNGEEVAGEPKEPTFKVFGVDEAGARTEVGEVRMTARTNPFPT